MCHGLPLVSYGVDSNMAKMDWGEKNMPENVMCPHNTWHDIQKNQTETTWAWNFSLSRSPQRRTAQKMLQEKAD